MKPVATKGTGDSPGERLHCDWHGGSHEKWETPGGLSDTLVAGDKDQSLPWGVAKHPVEVMNDVPPLLVDSIVDQSIRGTAASPVNRTVM
jgi:hypothetical protein